MLLGAPPSVTFTIVFGIYSLYSIKLNTDRLPLTY